jgi:hypothetical protein
MLRTWVFMWRGLSCEKLSESSTQGSRATNSAALLGGGVHCFLRLDGLIERPKSSLIVDASAVMPPCLVEV